MKIIHRLIQTMTLNFCINMININVDLILRPGFSLLISTYNGNLLLERIIITSVLAISCRYYCQLRTVHILLMETIDFIWHLLTFTKGFLHICQFIKWKSFHKISIKVILFFSHMHLRKRMQRCFEYMHNENAKLVNH